MAPAQDRADGAAADASGSQTPPGEPTVGAAGDTAEAQPSPATMPSEAGIRAASAPADVAAVQAILGATRQAARPPRRAWFSDLPDRGLFILFLIAGTAAVLGVKLLVPDAQLATWSATALACLTLLGYAALASRKEVPRDRLGDNCYYLGFLLTLASMAAALIQFDMTAGDRGRILERLIGSFGIALFSTFLGIALRVVFLQMRQEIDDIEDATRRELQERAELLKGQLLHTVTELESFRLRTRQVLDERLIAVTDAFAETARAQAEEALGLVRLLAAEGSRALGVQTDQAMRIEEAIRAQLTAAAALAERLGKVEVPPELFREEIRGLADRLALSVTPLERAASQIAERLDAVAVPSDLLAARIGRFTDALTRATEAVERLAQAELVRRTALDDAATRATRAIEDATRRISDRPRGFLSRLGFVLGLQRWGT